MSIRAIALIATVAAVLLQAAVRAEDAKAVIAAASQALGIAGLNSITYAGVAAEGNFGQSRTISFGLAGTSIRNYTRTIDFVRPASYAAGDAVPPAPRDAPPPQPAAYQHSIGPDSPWVEQYSIWVTPWGFLRGAAANSATLGTRTVADVSYKTLTWSPAQRAPSGAPYKVVGYIGPQNLVDRVDTWIEHPIFGDMPIEMAYRDYRDFAGVRSPTRMAQRNMGMEVFVVGVASVTANPPDVAQRLSQVRLAAPPPPPATASSERLADGVYRVTGGYVSLVVEFKDHVVVVEGGESEARGLAVIAETKRLFPSKRIKYVVNTHPHFDHAAGLPPFVAAGVTILENDRSRYFVEASFSSPRTLVGDVLAKSKKKPRVEGVLEKLVLQDETRSLELHNVKDLDHSDAMLIAYLPKEKILFTADFEIPAAGEPVSSSIPTLIANIERLHLDFERLVTVHAPTPDRPLTRGDLMALARGTK